MKAESVTISDQSPEWISGYLAGQQQVLDDLRSADVKEHWVTRDDLDEWVERFTELLNARM